MSFLSVLLWVRQQNDNMDVYGSERVKLACYVYDNTAVEAQGIMGLL